MRRVEGPGGTTPGGAQSDARPGGAPGAAWGEAEIRRLLRQLISERSDVPPDEIDDDRPLAEYGLTSRDAVAVSGELENALDAVLPATLLWEDSTVDRLVRRLARGAAEPGAPEGVVPGRDAARTSGPDARLRSRSVAVVGIGCRLPGGVEGPEAFWDYLLAGGNAAREVPEDRWQDFEDGSNGTAAALARTSRWGGFLGDIAGFDADFFGITPREAELMDPQQRLLLEVTWEALCHAGVPPSELHGTATGVFVGLSSLDYSHLTMAGLEGVAAWTSTGAAGSIAANRLSYMLDLHGPSMTIDTACSSSLVAVHQACRSLAAGECDTALAAGVNVLLSPVITANFDQAGALAPDGRCKAFDAAADGIVRGEGCGVVVLKPLDDARRAGDTILAVIRGTAVNSDGRSSGIMAPNPAAQEALLRDALRDADVDAADIDYVEAHGTGTLLGDPIEAGALGAVLGLGRPAGRPLLIGSVKTNLGHLEGAAGIVGLIKTVLSLHHGTLPASLHFRTPNPHIDFTAKRLRVVSAATEWPRAGHRPALAGVSAFGFGGTNAHAVLEQWSPAGSPAPQESAAPGAGEAPAPDAGPHVLVVTARSADRLGDAARGLAGWLTTAAGRQTPLCDVGHTLGHGRRDAVSAAVVGRGHQALAAGLLALADDRPSPGVVRAADAGDTAAVPGRGPVFVFSGYGSQWYGMGRGLLADDTAFAAAVDDLDAAFADVAGTALSRMIAQGVPTTAVHGTQSLLYGVQLALARTWQAYGVEPRAVIGHSMGEVAAAVVAGTLDARDGLRVILGRSALLATVEGARAGAMASVGLPEDTRAATLARFPGVVVAVHSSPRRCTVTGPAQPVANLVAELEEAGLDARLLDVHGAGHSAAVDVVLPALREALTGLRGKAPAIAWYGTVYDDPRDTPDPDAAYWCANLRRPVRLRHAVAAAAADGHTVFLEVSPHPIAALPIRETLDEAPGGTALVLPTLRRDDDESVVLRTSLAELHLAGAQHRRELLWPTGRRTALPAAPWRHVRHWVDGATRRRPPRADGHPLLGLRIDLPGTNRVLWQGDAGTGGWNHIERHVHGTAVLTLAACAQIVLAAATEATGVPPDAFLVRDLTLDHLLPLSDSTPVTTVWDPAGPDKAATVSIQTRSPAGTWLRHASATVVTGLPDEPRIPGTRDDDLPAVDVTLPHATGPDTPQSEALGALLDAGLHATSLPRSTAGAAQPEPDGDPSANPSPAALPFSLAALRVRLRTTPGPCRLRRRLEQAAGTRAGDNGQPPPPERWTVRLDDRDGDTVIEAQGVALRTPERAEIPLALAETSYEIVWDEVTTPPAADRIPANWLLLTTGSDDTSGRRNPFVPPLSSALERRGAKVAVGHCRNGSTGRILDAWRKETASAPGSVVLLCTGPADGSGVRGAVLAATEVARRLATVPGSGAGPRLWLVTERAVPVAAGEACDPDRACLRGLVRVLALEQPQLRACAVDVDRAPGLADDLVQELLGDSEADEVAWRDGTRFIARLASAAPDRDAAGIRFARPDGAYIVTGGLGGLGLATARRLAEHGAGRLVLNGRRPPAEDTRAVLDDLRALGTSVEVVQGDIAEPDLAARLLDAALAGGHALRGVAHAAGVLHDRIITDLEPDDVETVFRPKVDGALRLEEAVAGHSLDWWLVFSSAAALLGSPGQAAYAAANAWLDALVQRRRADGLPATSIAWGPWARIGGAPNTAAMALEPLMPAHGLDALQLLLAAGRPHTGVVRLDARRVVEAYPGMESVPFFTSLLHDIARETDHWGDPDQLCALGAQAPAAVRRRLALRAAAVMGYRTEDLDSSVPLTRLGLDSLMAVRIRNAVKHDFGVVLPNKLLMRGASLDDLTDELLSTLDLPGAPESVGVGDRTCSPSQSGPEPSRTTLLANAPGPSGRAPLPTTIAPRDAAERLVAGVWEQVLGRRPDGVLQNLRAAGGDDATARALALGIHARLDEPPHALTPEQILARPTVESIADLIRPAVNGDGATPLRVLRDPGGTTTRAPLFVFHPAGGPTSVYRPLVRLLPADQPVYGCERVDELASMEEKAKYYLDLMRRIQPRGPYQLLGWSFGGCQAYEIAVQLRDRGEDAGYLGLIDTILPAALPGSDSQEIVLERFRRFADYVETTFGHHLPLPYEELPSMTDDDQIMTVMRLVAETGLSMSPGILEHQRTSYVDARIGERYRPRPYPGHVTLYRAQEPQVMITALDPRYLRDEADLGWAPLCPSLEVVPVPGDHLSLIDPPHIAVIAQHLAHTLHGAAEPDR
ncbi:SDR family NAD(P)-dependent oxidoreductase [Kitasatospora sp. NBC_00085]|uniref:SDR family NAD(P)-dependent oxidoreductase n=1 Tax=unclassified Kitasatospora TaxID=2633591 RepID=UPI0032469CF7